MPKRVKVVPEEEARGSEQVEDVPAETRRTRSGRRIRAPAPQPPATPGRRTRSSVAQERVAAEDKIVEEPERSPERPVETKSAASPEPPVQVQVQDQAATADPEAAETVSRPPAVETAPLNSETVPKKKPHLAPSAKKIPAVPLGKPKSGRVWKDRNKQRFSALVRDKPLNSSWEKKMQAKREKQLLKQYSVKLTEEKARQKEEKRLRREENLKRRAENERKSEIVQVIRNTTKIKRMKKKQLRKIEKRDTLALLQKSQKQNKKTKTQKNVEQELT